MKKLIFAIYSRKSKFTGIGESVENQVELCKKYIEDMYRHEFETETIIYEDEGFSGGNMQRPKFKEMLSDARKRKFNILICYRLDRVSRNVSDFSSVIEEIAGYGIDFVSIKERFDTSTPMGRAMMYISSVFAQLERETIAERIRDNMLELAKTGRWLGGTTPTGYQSQAVSKKTLDGKQRKLFKLVEIPDEKATILLIFQKYLELKSLTALQAYMLNAEIKSKNDKAYSRFALRAILSNPVYAAADQNTYRFFHSRGIFIYSDKSCFNGEYGMMCYNKTRQNTKAGDRFRDMSEWIVAVGKHKGFIPGQQWVGVQELLMKNGDKTYRKPRKNLSVFSGLVKCGVCGENMRPKIHRPDSDAFSYVCQKKENSKCSLCNNKNIPGEHFDKTMIEFIWKAVEERKGVFDELIKVIDGVMEDHNEQKENEINAFENSLSKNRHAITNLIDKLKYIDAPAISEDILNEVKKLKEKNQQLEKRIDLLSQTKKQTDQYKNTAAMFQTIVSHNLNLLDSLDIQEKREFIRLLIEKIVVNGQDVAIYFLGNSSSNAALLSMSEDCK